MPLLQAGRFNLGICSDVLDLSGETSIIASVATHIGMAF